MLDTAVTLAVLISASFYMAYKKLPRNVRRWIVKHGFIVDVMCMLVTYWTLGGTVTALLAGALVDVIISAMIHVAEHPEDFIWLFDLMDRAKKMMAEMKVKLLEMNQRYKAAHPDAQVPIPLSVTQMPA